MLKHGHCRIGVASPTWVCWSSMIQRCSDPNSTSYEYYGGRGIRVCKRWRKFSNFLKDMGERPEGLLLDRIKTNHHYTPRNCRWATRLQSDLNTRRNVFLRFNGKRQTVYEWAKETGISSETIRARKKRGWSTKDALTSRVRGGRWIKFNREMLRLQDWSKRIKIPATTLLNRFSKGWTTKDALTRRPRRSRWSV